MNAPTVLSTLAVLALGLSGALPAASADPPASYAGLGIVFGPSYGAACELGLTVYAELTVADGALVAHAATLEGNFLLRSELGATTIEFDCGAGPQTVTTGAPVVTHAACGAGTGELEFTVADFAFYSGLVACAQGV